MKNIPHKRGLRVQFSAKRRPRPHSLRLEERAHAGHERVRFKQATAFQGAESTGTARVCCIFRLLVGMQNKVQETNAKHLSEKALVVSAWLASCLQCFPTRLQQLQKNAARTLREELQEDCEQFHCAATWWRGQQEETARGTARKLRANRVQTQNLAVVLQFLVQFSFTGLAVYCKCFYSSTFCPWNFFAVPDYNLVGDQALHLGWSVESSWT